MISTVGFGTGLNVDDAGVNVRFNGEPRSGVKFKNVDESPVYAIINRVITGAADALGTAASVPGGDSNFSALTAAQARAIGYFVDSGEEIEFFGLPTVNSGPTIHRLSLICAALGSTTVEGGSVEI